MAELELMVGWPFVFFIAVCCVVLVGDWSLLILGVVVAVVTFGFLL